MVSSIYDVLILGGGLAGGVCARELLALGHSVMVIEKNKLGGLLRGINFVGNNFDQGPHFFYHDRELREVRHWIEELDETKDYTPYAWSLPKGHMDEPHDYPISRANAFRWLDSDRIMAELCATNCAGVNTTNRFSSHVRFMVGNTFYSRYFENFSKKFWGINPDNLAAEWIPKKIRITDLHEPFFNNNDVYRPVEGFTDFISHMFNGIPILYDKVLKLEVQDNMVASVICRKHGNLKARYYISSIRPDRLLGKTLLNVRGLVLLYALIDTSSPLFFKNKGVYWAYVPNHYSFTRVTDITKACGFPSTTQTVLCFEFPVKQSSEGKRKIFEEEVQDFLDTCNVRVVKTKYVLVPEAYPILSSTNMKKLKDLTSSLDCLSNLYRTGRFGLFRFIWMADTIVASLKVANSIHKQLRK